MDETQRKLQEEYLKAMRENADQMSVGEQSSPDVAPDDIQGTDFAAKAQADQAAVQAPAAKPSGLDAAGDATMTAGAMGANPYVAGAGLALKTVGAVDSAKRAAEQAKIDAYNKKIMARRSAIKNLFE